MRRLESRQGPAASGKPLVRMRPAGAPRPAEPGMGIAVRGRVAVSEPGGARDACRRSSPRPRRAPMLQATQNLLLAGALVLGATLACGGGTPPPNARPQAPTGSTPPEETPVSRGPGDLASEPTASSASRAPSDSPHPGLQAESERGTGGAELGPPATKLN